MTNAMPTVTLPDGEVIPKRGQGTWEWASFRMRARPKLRRCARASNWG